MKRKTILLALAIIVFVLIGLSRLARAQTGSEYDLTWWTVDGGGVMNSIGGTYTLDGAIAQYDVGTQTGAGYTLVGGFWNGRANQYQVFLPLTLR